MVWPMGFRNILRNKRRTLLSALAIGIGLACLIIADGFVIGMRESMVKTITSSYLGHGQIHRKGYRANPEAEKTILNYSDVIQILNKNKHVKHWSPRTLSIAMVTTPANVLNIQIVGVDPEKEKHVSRLEKSIIEGKYLSQNTDIIIGKKLAKKLDIRIGEKLVLTVVQSQSDELSQELFRVSAIVQFGSKGLDDGLAFIHRARLQDMLKMPGAVHEVSLSFHDIQTSQNLQSPLWQQLQSEGNSTESWMDLVPGVIAAIELSKSSTAIMAMILFVIVLIGIINTLFMAIYERMYEFGVLQAIGTRPFMIFKLILAEATWLGIISIIVGIGVTFLVGGIMNINGIDYSGIEMGEATFSEPIFTVFTTQQFTVFPLFLIIFTIIAAIYPAIHAARITIASAMKKSL